MRPARRAGQLAEWILTGSGPGLDVAAADEVKRRGWSPTTTSSVLLLDNSAWARLLSGVVPAERAQAIAAWMEAGELAVCLPFLLEAGYSARSAADGEALMARFAELPRVAIDGEVERVALQAQRELAEIGHHRLPPADVAIAACAHRAEAGAALRRRLRRARRAHEPHLRERVAGCAGDSVNIIKLISASWVVHQFEKPLRRRHSAGRLAGIR